MIIRFELSCQTRSTHRHIKRTRTDGSHATPHSNTHTHTEHMGAKHARARPCFFKCASIHEVESSRYRASDIHEQPGNTVEMTEVDTSCARL